MKGAKGSAGADPELDCSKLFREQPTPCSIPQGFLLLEEGNKKKKKPDNYAARDLAVFLCGVISFDQLSGTWAIWSGNHWVRQLSDTTARRKIAELVEKGTDPQGYNNRYLNAIIEQIKVANRLPHPKLATNVVPFANGLLEIGTGELTDATPDNATEYVLPHKYDPGAQCPTILSWLHDSVDGDGDTVEVLRAWLAALVRGISVQKFLVLIGPGGTSKGAFQRLAVALIGKENTETSSLRSIEGNSFEMAKYQGKRLCLLNEVGCYEGPVPNLKAMTGGDYLPLERKHQQQTGSFVFAGLVLLATNEYLGVSDSGVDRRSIYMRFDRKPSAADKRSWWMQGGEEKVLHSEIPGLIRWLLEMPREKIKPTLEALSGRILKDKAIGTCAGSSVAEWLNEECEFDEKAKTQIGRVSSNKKQQREMLYPNYRSYCDGTGRKPISQNKFTKELFRVASDMGHALIKEMCPTSRLTFVVGVRLIEIVSAFDSSIRPIVTEGTMQKTSFKPKGVANG